AHLSSVALLELRDPLRVTRLNSGRGHDDGRHIPINSCRVDERKRRCGALAVICVALCGCVRSACEQLTLQSNFSKASFRNDRPTQDWCWSSRLQNSSPPRASSQNCRPTLRNCRRFPLLTFPCVAERRSIASLAPRPLQWPAETRLIIIVTWEEFDESEAKPQRISAGHWPCCNGVRNRRDHHLRLRLCLGAVYDRN